LGVELKSIWGMTMGSQRAESWVGRVFGDEVVEVIVEGFDSVRRLYRSERSGYATEFVLLMRL
jgi:hypothetical protein